MKKPIIGIVGILSQGKKKSLFEDNHQFINTYAKKVVESGGLPIGLIAPDGKIDYQTLELCDGILIPGGNKIWRYIIQTLYFALKNDLPVLGICLGGEAISIFSALSERIDFNKDLTLKKANKIWRKLKWENNGELLRRLPKGNIHAHYNITRKNINDAKHPIIIEKGTLMYDIYKKKEIQGISFHSFDFKFVNGKFIISGVAPDGVREVIEHIDPNTFMLGVHFHPELSKNNQLFDRLSYEAEKRKIKKR